MLFKFKMLDYLRISDGLTYEIMDDACGIMLGHLDREVYSPENKIIPIKKVRSQIVDHLSGLYSSKILKKDPGILVKETFHTIVEVAAMQLSYERRYVDITSENGQPLEGKVLDDEVTEELTGYPIYWVIS